MKQQINIKLDKENIAISNWNIWISGGVGDNLALLDQNGLDSGIRFADLDHYMSMELDFDMVTVPLNDPDFPDSSLGRALYIQNTQRKLFEFRNLDVSKTYDFEIAMYPLAADIGYLSCTHILQNVSKFSANDSVKIWKVQFANVQPTASGIITYELADLLNTQYPEIAAIIIKVSDQPVESPELEINISGLPDSYEVYVGQTLWPDHKKSFPSGTILDRLKIEIEGYIIDPPVVNSITILNDAILNFAATPKPMGRHWSLNLGNEYTGSFTELGIIWNHFYPTMAQYSVANGLTVSNLVTEDNVIISLSVTNLTAVDGFSAQYVDYQSSQPVYPKIAVDSGMGITSQGGTLRFAGGNPAKTYKLSVFACSSSNNSAIQISNGSQSVVKVITNNFPTDGSNRYDNPSLITLYNIQPDTAGIFDLNFSLAGSYYLTIANLILIQENP
jgi:hypothetical protein